MWYFSSASGIFYIVTDELFYYKSAVTMLKITITDGQSQNIRRIYPLIGTASLFMKTCHSLHVPHKPFHAYWKEKVVTIGVKMGSVVWTLEIFFAEVLVTHFYD